MYSVWGSLECSPLRALVRRRGSWTKKLSRAGISRRTIRAAWPDWWSDELEASPSARTELRFVLARRLGVSPRSLLGERVEFVWNDDVLFKNLTAEDGKERAALASFGIVIGRALISGAGQGRSLVGIEASTLRQAILANRECVDLVSLVSVCWALGVPVVHLRVFPLESKRMHAMVATVGDRAAILLGRDARYPAVTAFSLAHEVAHVALGHAAGATAIVDLKDPASTRSTDPQETEADRFALTLLTGRPDPVIQPSTERFTARALADAALNAAPRYAIEPGTLALCLGYQLNAWPVVMASLRYIYSEGQDVWQHINEIAMKQLDWTEISGESTVWLNSVLTGNLDG